jgi:diguanylate cyclase (GGDEF)-like protein/PAS domain S-box-containing protein
MVLTPSKTDFRIIIIDDNTAIHQDFLKILTTINSSTISHFDNVSRKLFDSEESDTDLTLPIFEISTASQGQEGVEKIKTGLNEGRPFALAFVDVRMPPGWDGIETIKHIWELDKDIQIVICTAYSDYTWEETIANLGKTDNLLILKKPFDNISVRQLACALTKKWQLLQESRRYVRNLEKEVKDRTFSLETSLSLIKSTFESSSDGILVVNNEGKVIDYNQKLIDMLQLSKEIIATKSEEKILESLKYKLANPEDFIKKLNEFHFKINEISIETIKFQDGRVFECYSQPHTLNETIVGRILDFRDITQRAKLEDKLQHQATHDSLTGLANREKLIECIQSAIKVSELNNSVFAVLFLDFDRFKLINDSLSHEVGDKVLQAAAKRLNDLIRSTDTLSRLGGDEFVIILSNILHENDLIIKVQQILSEFQKPFHIAERKLTLTASIGISLFPNDGKTVNTLLRNADAAMYSAKGKKGNNFQFYTSDLNIKSLDALDQESELRQAIANKEFILCYQPQIDLIHKKFIAVEALIRWQHPTKGLLLPLDFIPVAEETGLICPIGEWVLRQACMQNKAWQKAGLPPIRVAVNVTAQQFKIQNVVDLVSSILKETELEPKYLELELTENVILSNKEIIEAVTQLKKLGVMIAIDDFGTGYSSLSYLHRIPLDRLKIDSSFIQHIQSATDDEVIIRAVISMAKNLDLEVLAEGVETEDQLNFLKKYECSDVQGYYFSKPLVSSELEVLLRNSSSPEKFSKLIHLK